MKTKEEERALCQSVAESYLNDPAEHPRNGLSFLEDMLVDHRAAAREEMKEAVLTILSQYGGVTAPIIKHRIRALETGVEK